MFKIALRLQDKIIGLENSLKQSPYQNGLAKFSNSLFKKLIIATSYSATE